MPSFVGYRSMLVDAVERMGTTPRTVLGSIFSIDPTLADMATHALIEEEIWIHYARPTVYVDSTQLPDQVSNMSMFGEVGQILINRWRGLRAFCFHSNSMVGGVNLRPVLFGVTTAEDRHPLVEACVARVLEMPEYALHPHWATEPCDTVTLTIPCGEMAQRLVVPLSELQVFLEDPDWIKTHKLKNNWFPIEQSQEDMDLLMTMMRAILGLIVYTQAFPEAIRDGLPTLPPRKLGFGALACIPRTIKGLVRHQTAWSTGDGEPFFRSAHLRILGHERFTHNPDGSPKVILVKDTVVGGRIDAKVIDTGAHS